MSKGSVPATQRAHALWQQTSSVKIFFSVVTDSQWAAFCTAVGWQAQFADPALRADVERIMHPRIEARRRAQFAAAPLSTRALIIDAPLLFEVGLERECDAVLFVDTPRDLRLARVRASRGWDDAELARREASQIPLEEKRRRSSDLVANTGDPAALEAAVAAALDAIIARTAPT